MNSNTNKKMKECIVICHGKSEYSIMTYIKQAYRLPIKVIGNKKGKNSIQITSLLDYLNRREFKNRKNFLEHFNLDNLTNNTKIYTVMDTDDCDLQQYQKYLNKSMFNQHFLKNHIIPIYNEVNLEDVLKRVDLHVYVKKSEAVKIFPLPNKKNILTKDDSIKYVYDKLQKDNRTNFDNLILYCMKNKAQF
ncbi:hypothetical protein [Staphylococcus hominis]|uniref:hypothetical protein n=1 Tax=Staphylococcus hominis TaxID=1290 RepID=UPI000B3B0B3F|nr:hypothetical protein [Staphylococcus hominis]AUJ52607.1 hypothetical protein B7P03_08395 [Staphylococcus hominis subsp. hominis]